MSGLREALADLVWLKDGPKDDDYYEAKNAAWQAARDALAAHPAEPAPVADEDTSDGYHTFKELYRFRLLYNAALFSHWAQHDPYTDSHHGVHKSWRHYDGEECFGGGWFIVMATLPTGQISNHYEAKDWDFFQVPERERADEWDGHTAQDVADRLEAALRAGNPS